MERFGLLAVKSRSRKYDDIKEEYKHYKDKDIKLEFILNTSYSESNVIQVQIKDIILSLLLFAERERKTSKLDKLKVLRLQK